MRKSHLGAALAASALALLGDTQPAEACGGCFVPQSESSVVTDHRMAFSMTKERTILWDQIRYSGDPDEFAWVLPIKNALCGDGTRCVTVELANDEFFTALDTSTQPRVFQPRGVSREVGCGIGGCSSDESASLSAENGGNGGVNVISQSIVGPYNQVTLSANDPDALVNWLNENGFVLPGNVVDTVKAYVREQFDFVALKLRPNCGQRSMQPVRVVTRGADPTLPLRMVAAGVGPTVGITLFVLTESQQKPSQPFFGAYFEDDALLWDRAGNKSNYEALSQQIMNREGGRTWLIEYANKPQISLSTGYQPQQSIFGGSAFPSPGLSNTYYGLCKGHQTVTVTPGASSGGFGTSGGTSSGGTSGGTSGGVGLVPCPETPKNDGGVTSSDAGGDAGGDSGIGDGEDPGQPVDSGTPNKQPTGNAIVDCAYLDDLDAALQGADRSNVWVTRLRAILPASTLTTDLKIEPILRDGKPDTVPVNHLHWAPYYTDEVRQSNDKTSCEGSPKRHRTYGSWVIAVSFAIFGVSVARRRKRR